MDHGSADRLPSLRLCGRAEFLQRLSAFEARLWKAAPRLLELGGGTPSPATVADRVLELSDLYTLDRSAIARGARHRGHLLAKVLYFLCSDAPKVRLVLEELAARNASVTCRGGRFRCLDLGCGCGATSVGLILALAGADVPSVIDVVDSDPANLAIAEAAIRMAGEVAGVDVLVQPREADLLAMPASTDIDLVVCQAAINELPSDGLGDDEPATGAVEVVHAWAQQTWTILIEPALRVTTRPLHVLRNRVLERGGIRVVAPCPHQRPCPMLETPRHWCHEIRRFPPAPMVAEVQGISRRRDERTKFSFAVFAPDAPAAGATPDRPLTGAEALLEGRIVSDALVTRGKTERIVCSTEGALVRLRLLDRERTEANAALATAERGATVRIAGEAKLPRVGPGATVAIAEPRDAR